MSEPVDLMNARYLSIIDEARSYPPKLQALTRPWINYLREYGDDPVQSFKRLSTEWHGTYVSNGIVFRTEQDKVWFLLRWS
jgi:hypothetical protein